MTLEDIAQIIEFKLWLDDVLEYYSMWGYYAYMKSQERLPAGAGIVFYRFFKLLIPKHLEKARESFEMEEWINNCHITLDEEQAKHLRPGEEIYVSPLYPTFIGLEKRTAPQNIRRNLNLDTEKPHIVEEVRSDYLIVREHPFPIPRVRIKVRGVDELFSYDCFGKKVDQAHKQTPFGYRKFFGSLYSGDK